jgi:ATP-dependent protease ClpP protease subunit
MPAEMKETKYCFRQEADSNVHQLYIYDEVSEYGEFDWWSWSYAESETSAEFFRKALADIPETDTIELHINSLGGSVKEGVAIYNQLRQKKCKEIVAYVDGFAYSVASLILQAADRRIVGLGTSLLIHNAWLTVSGNAEDLRKAADDLDVLMESNRKVYLEKCNISEDELIEMMEKETYLTPDQAIEMGFADEIAESQKADPDATATQLQQQLSQMREMLVQERAFKADLKALQTATAAGAKESAKDDDETNGEGTKGKESPTEETKNKLASLLAKAAANNYLKSEVKR